MKTARAVWLVLLLGACGAACTSARWERRLASLPGDGTVVRGIAFLHKEGDEFVLDLESLDGEPTERRRLEAVGDEPEVTIAMTQLLRRHPGGVRVTFDGVHFFGSQGATEDPNQLLPPERRAELSRVRAPIDAFSLIRCRPVGGATGALR